MPRMYEQADKTGDRVTYSWILDGLKRGYARRLPGWKYVGRCCWVTNDAALAARHIGREVAGVTSNGTHAVHGVPGLLCVVAEQK